MTSNDLTMKNYRERAIELFNGGLTSRTDIAKKLSDEFNFEYNDNLRKKVSYWIQKETEHLSGVFQECESEGINPDNVSSFWYKSKRYSINVKNPKETFDTDKFKDEIVAEISKWSPNYPKINRESNKDSHCLLFDPSDIHISKLCSSFETGEDYNSQIAIKRVMDGLHGIIQKSNGFNIDKIIFVAGNDILHVDNPKRQTTSGTPQDTDSSMWYDSFLIAKRLLVDIIETLVQIADVEVVFNPSNHDYMSGFMLLDGVKGWFRNHPNVTFNSNMAHRKYTVYGQNLIGTTHMDGAKPQDLPLLMAHEAPNEWAECKHRYIFGHHVHHKTSKDYMSVNLETLRSPSGTDSWHHRNGYQHAPKAVEAFIFHPDHGQVARLTHIF